jgi:pimeloyl-ACP methyl ester carboxylesterase
MPPSIDSINHLSLQELLLKYTNENSRFLVAKGNLIHYRDEGSGFPVLCLHGAFSSLHTWNSWTKELMPHYRVLRYDLPGFGLTGAIPEKNYSIEHHLSYMDDFLDVLGIEKCHIVGNSLGGWLAWEYAIARPSRVAKMILIDAAGFLDANSIPAPFTLARLPFADRIVKTVIQRDFLEIFLRQVYCDQSKITERLIDRYYDLFTREGNQEAFFLLVNQRLKENTRRLRHIDTPTLIMWGEEDEWIPVANADRFLQLIPDSEGIIYENVGHLPMEEIPKQTSADAIHFLR